MMATETQDVRMPVKKDAQGRNTSDKFDLGRNFCNKLFNATKFVVSHLESTGKPDFKREDLALADKWILSRLMRTIGEVDAALAAYRFDVYARSCYDFFWRDVCDWYLEVNKQTLRDPKEAGRIGSILAAVLDASLRLMHPMIPFITEMLWQKLNDIRPDRSLPGLYEPKSHKFLIHAAWPIVNPSTISETDEITFTKIQESITAIRNLRSEYKVDQKHNLPLSIIPQAGFGEIFQTNVGTINLLSTSTATILAPNSPPIPGSVRASTSSAEIFVAGLVDANAEKQRLLKRQQELKQQVLTLQGRMSNESYIAKAPPHLVKQTQDQLAAAQAELAKIEAELGKL
jgi:valyl-tRNA synthetase